MSTRGLTSRSSGILAFILPLSIELYLFIYFFFFNSKAESLQIQNMQFSTDNLPIREWINLLFSSPKLLRKRHLDSTCYRDIPSATTLRQMLSLERKRQEWGYNKERVVERKN